MSVIACSVHWQKDVEKNGIFFSKLRFNEQSDSYTGYVQRDIRVKDIKCKKGWVRFYGDWKLKSCVANQDLRLSGNFLPKGTWFQMDRGGRLRLCAFPRDMEINGIICRGTGGNPKASHTRFYPDGALEFCSLPKDEIVKGIPCKGGMLHMVGFYPDGSVKLCDLAENFVYKGEKYKKGDTIKPSP